MRPITLSEYFFAKSTWWRLHKIVVPNSLLIFFNRDKIKFAALGSKLATGSSANNNNGLLIIALAIPTLCLWPPDNSSYLL